MGGGVSEPVKICTFASLQQPVHYALRIHGLKTKAFHLVGTCCTQIKGSCEPIREYEMLTRNEKSR